MQTIVSLLMYGMVFIVVFFGSGGLVNNLITGTNTSDVIYKAGLPVVICLTLLVIAIMRIGRSKKRFTGGQ